MNNLIQYSFPLNLSKNAVIYKHRKVIFSYPCESKDDCFPYEITLKPGIYKFECWGAGDSLVYGSYTSGIITFLNEIKLYLYIGTTHGIFNVIHPDTTLSRTLKPNGATDIRYEPIDEEYYSFKSLKARIMVAASGGVSDDLNGEFGHGGALTGERGLGNISRTGTIVDPPKIAPGATQTSSGICNSDTMCIEGTFGLARQNIEMTDNGGTGGGGYYAGCSINPSGNGGGGSSFISGHQGCNAISEESNDFNSIKHTNQSIHYSGLVFYNTKMKPGKETMYTDPGKIEITVLTKYITCEIKKKNKNIFILIFISVIISY